VVAAPDVTSFAFSSGTAADYPAFVRLFPELAIPDPLPSAERFADLIAPQAIFARDGDAIVGYAWSRPRGERLHVVHVITDPAHRRRGVGRATMLELSKRARAAGFRRWMLHVKPENVAALKLYAVCGMQIILESAQLRLACEDIARLPSPPPGTTTRTLAPSDDVRVEQALGMARGDFSGCRAVPGRVFLGAAMDGVPSACVAFDPTLPGAPVLRARSPGDARAVLEGILPYALPQHTGFFLFVEGNPGLESTLVGIGAKVTMRALRMEGDVEDAGTARG
jgi:GNAT superfamily N-acetyltransferase